MGDSNGVLSIWRIGRNKNYSSPLLISNSLEISLEVIEDLEWTKEGDVLLVNCLKGYVTVYKFQKSNFGKEITQEQKL